MDYYAGSVWSPEGFYEGYVGVSGGKIAETGDGRPPEPAVAEGFIVPGTVNCHTHMGDAGLSLCRRYSLEELVAPPDGLKHRYLDNADPEWIESSMRAHWGVMQLSGFSTVIDFRECGKDGCHAIEDAVPGAVVLGRPRSQEYDEVEVSDLLRTADGIGLSGLADQPMEYSISLTSAAKKAGKMFAMHLSEAVREDLDAALSLEPDFLVHMGSASREDMLRCADEGIPVVVCPRSNDYFGIVPKIGEMVSAGMHLALGTDNAMLSDGRLAPETVALAKVLSSQGGDPEKAVDIAFEGWKKILYHKRKIGLGVGMEADLTVFPAERGNRLLDVMKNVRPIRITGRNE